MEPTLGVHVAADAAVEVAAAEEADLKEIQGGDNKCLLDSHLSLLGCDFKKHYLLHPSRLGDSPGFW